MRVTLNEVKEFSQTIEDLIVSKHIKLVINLHEVEYVDSTIIGAIVVNSKKLRAKGGEIAIVTGKESVKQVFDTSGLTKIFDFYTNVEDAIEGLKMI